MNIKKKLVKLPKIFHIGAWAGARPKNSVLVPQYWEKPLILWNFGIWKDLCCQESYLVMQFGPELVNLAAITSQDSLGFGTFWNSNGIKPGILTVTCVHSKKNNFRGHLTQVWYKKWLVPQQDFKLDITYYSRHRY